MLPAESLTSELGDLKRPRINPGWATSTGAKSDWWDYFQCCSDLTREHSWHAIFWKPVYCLVTWLAHSQTSRLRRWSEPPHREHSNSYSNRFAALKIRRQCHKRWAELTGSKKAKSFAFLWECEGEEKAKLNNPTKQASSQGFLSCQECWLRFPCLGLHCYKITQSCCSEEQEQTWMA